MSTFISKETVNRLLRDVKNIMKHPLTEQGIYYIHDDTDMLKGYAMIVGPSDTPYFGGFYFFEFLYPTNYPFSPPKVRYCTNGSKIRFNPNLYVCGKVCVSVLNTWSGEQWSACQTISTILLTLCTLLCKDPLLNEPNVDNKHFDFNNYNEAIEHSNINIAVCDIVKKTQGIYLPFFEHFYPYVKEHFYKNYDRFVEFANKKRNEDLVENKTLHIGLYNMRVFICYEDILLKLQEAKELADIF
jgi:ubiquitin-protein ligase